MKLFLPTTLLFLGISLSAQMPGMMTVQSGSQGTALGANDTIAYNGIALGNRVKMRGFVDFIFSHDDTGDATPNPTDFATTGDVDFLFDLSPVTAELHLAMNPDAAKEVELEQAFGRYSFNNMFHLTFGRQLTSLGFEADEAPGLYAVTNAYKKGVRRNYVDGLRANFNNGQFGFVLGLHDSYLEGAGNLDDQGMAIDIAASVMIIPGLEAQLGFANDNMSGGEDDHHFNAWIAYNPNDLTLAFEYDDFELSGKDLWDIMFLVNYQFVDWFGATLRYSHEDHENDEIDRITMAFLFTVTDNLFFNLEYSHTDDDGSDMDEFRVEGLLTF
jgi:hypothetical protein